MKTKKTLEQEKEKGKEREKEKEKENPNKDEEEATVIQLSINDDLLGTELEKSFQEESFLNLKSDRDLYLENGEKTKEKEENRNQTVNSGQINETKPPNETVNPTPTISAPKSRRISLLSEKKSTSSGRNIKTNSRINNYLESLESSLDSGSSSSDFKPNSGSESDHLVVSETELEIMIKENSYRPKTEDEPEEEGNEKTKSKKKVKEKEKKEKGV
eukprot:Anaeramoba_flamelloidesc40729_g1_i1.p1 GENE.c40729_g1_i1~~c40729_g1_i1.p1  ORF type:complete len:216 (-),score=76.70 c40729_g1_i1:791-1438(-)